MTQKDNNTKIVITNKGGLPVPVYVTIAFANKHVWTAHYGADIWEDGKKEISIEQKDLPKIRGIRLGNNHVPDKFEKDNTWIKKN